MKIIELIIAIVFSWACGFSLGLVYQNQISKLKRKRQAEIEESKIQPPFIKAAIKMGRGLQRAILYGPQKPDNPPPAEKVTK